MSRAYSQTAQNSPVTSEIKEVMPKSNISPVAAQLLTKSAASVPYKKFVSKKPLPLKNSFVLTFTDSVKLNIVKVAPTANGYFDNNILTRSLQPLSAMASDKLVVKVDSLNSYIPMNMAYAPPSTLIKNSLDSTGLLRDSLLQGTLDTLPKPVVKTTHISVVSKDQETRSPSLFQDSKIFLLVIVLFSVALLGYVRLKSNKFIKAIFKGLFTYHESQRLFTTVNVRNSLNSVILDFLFVFNMGILVFELGALFMGSSGLLMSLLFFVGGMLAISLYFGLKIMLFRTISYIFSTKEETSEYLFFVGIVNKIFGILLIPFLIVLPFTTGVGTYIALGVLVSIYGSLTVLQVIRGFQIILQKPISLFYLILYLCTLEILPVVIALRIFNK